MTIPEAHGKRRSRRIRHVRYAETVTGLQPLETRPDNLTDLVFQALRDSIVDQSLRPGSRVSEAGVAAQLKVSKTPVREALLRLRHVGLVESVGERGLQVIQPSIQAIRNAYELRASIERGSAFFAAHRATSEVREELLDIAQASLRAAEDGDGSAFRRIDPRFHRLIASASANTMITRSVEDSLVLCAVLRERDVPRAGDSVACANEHVAIAQAILAGEADAAGERNADHILHVMALVLSARASVN